MSLRIVSFLRLVKARDRTNFLKEKMVMGSGVVFFGLTKLNIFSDFFIVITIFFFPVKLLYCNNIKVHEYANISNLYFRMSMPNDSCPVVHWSIIFVNIFYEIRFRAVASSFISNT